MRYQIIHTTHYTYNQAVFLEPHLVRLRPRTDSCQTLHAFAVDCSPEPTGQYSLNDVEGNTIIRLWFRDPTDYLSVKVTSTVETHRINPFDFLLEPWATQIPIDYPASLLSSLQPYWLRYSLPTAVDSSVMQLAQDVSEAIAGEVVPFLSELNQRIHQSCEYVIRETGMPWPAATTWQKKQGSCRDLTLLFIEACRAVNLAARFVSGYQEGDLNQRRRDLHAWAEVYLPGAGWRAYDPTNGIAVADRHIALVASVLPADAAPISGRLRGGGQSDLQYEIAIERLSG